MGQAIVRGALAAEAFAPHDIVACDPSAAAATAAAVLGVTRVTDARALQEADTLLIAVKPQQFHTLASALGALERPTLVISVMAGVQISAIEAALGAHARVMRVMPNTAAQVGEGMAAVCRGGRCTDTDVAATLALFDTVGATLQLGEHLMDAATAVCGSGPAYLYRLAEGMMTGARGAGMDDATADAMVRQTLLGAAALLRQTSESPAALRASVTSPGGTTAAALAVLDDARFEEVVAKAVLAARDRGRALRES